MAMDKHPIEKINFGVIPITVYRGCILTKIIGGYEIFGTKCKTPQQVDEVIDNAGTILNESLANPVTVKDSGSWVSLNSEDK